MTQSPPWRPLDTETPGLDLVALTERSLALAVGPDHPFARRRSVEVEALAGQVWVASRSERGDQLLGVWPGLAERAEVRYLVRDWLAKLQLVAAGLAITTVAPTSMPAAVAGIHVVEVRGEPEELRRVLLARLPGRPAPEVQTIADAIAGAARQ